VARLLFWDRGVSILAVVEVMCQQCNGSMCAEILLRFLNSVVWVMCQQYNGSMCAAILLRFFNFRRAAFSTYHHLTTRLTSSEITVMVEKRDAEVSGYI
jgi:cytosine/uracil/thiamine/allantoin permease